MALTQWQLKPVATDSIASGDFLAFTDEGESGDPINKITIDNLATFLAGGSNISASSGVLNVDDAFLKNDASDSTSGTVTMAHLIVGDGGNVGSASDGDAIAIAANGVVTFSQSVTLADDATITLQDEGQLIFTDDDPSTEDTGVGIVMKFTALTGLAVGELVHIDANGKIDQAHADATADMPAIGIALTANSSGSDANIQVLLQGFYRDDSLLSFGTMGAPVYVDHSAEGDFTLTPSTTDGHFIQRVGISVTDDMIYFSPSLDVIERD